VLLFGCSVLRYTLDAQLFLQTQPTSHRQHIMSQLQIMSLSSPLTSQRSHHQAVLTVNIASWV